MACAETEGVGDERQQSARMSEQPGGLHGGPAASASGGGGGSSSSSETEATSGADVAPSSRRHATSIEKQRLQSGRNRLGTPRHGFNNNNGGGACEVPAQGPPTSKRTRPKCDNSQLIDLNTTNSALSSDQSLSEQAPLGRGPLGAAPAGAEAPDGGEPANQAAGGGGGSASEMSLSSNLNQAPPSYTTATRASGAAGDEATSGEQFGQPEVPLALSGQPSSAAAATVAVLGGQAFKALGQGPSEQLAAKNRNDSYGFLKFAPTDSAGADNDRRLQAPAGQQLPGPACPLGRASRRPDDGDGIYATIQATAAVAANNQQLQQPVAALWPTAPNGRLGPAPPGPPGPQINHAISPPASMQLQQQWPQTNQLQLDQLAGSANSMGSAALPPRAQMSISRTLPHSLYAGCARQQCTNQATAAPIYQAPSLALLRAPMGALANLSAAAAASSSSCKLALDAGGAPGQPIGSAAKIELVALAPNAPTNQRKPLAGRPTATLSEPGVQVGAAATTTTTTQTTRLARREQQHRKRKRHRSASGQGQHKRQDGEHTPLGSFVVEQQQQQQVASRDRQTEQPLDRSLACGAHLDAAWGATISAGEGSQQQQQQRQRQQQAADAPPTAAAISAHCWLIDSSDENSQRRRREHNNHGAHPPPPPDGTETMASRPGRVSGRKWNTLKRPPASGAAPAPLDSRPPSGSQTLRCSSSRQQRQARRRHRVGSSSRHCLSPAERPGRRRHRCADHSPGERGQQLECCWLPEGQKECAGLVAHNSAPPHDSRRQQQRPGSSAAGPAPRLSSLLSFLASLVAVGRSRAASCAELEAPSGHRCSQDECGRRHARGQRQEMPYQLASVSSSFAPSAAPQHASNSHSCPLAATGPGSLAYSSSTNTSAYVTGSSSLHSHADCQGDAWKVASLQQRRPIRLVQLNSANIVQEQQQQQGRHSYEYCDQEASGAGQAPPSMSTDCAYNLRQLGGAFEQIELEPMESGAGRARASSCSAGSSGSSTSSPSSSGRRTMSPAQLAVGLNHSGIGDQSRLAQILVSDNELLSAASEALGQQRLGPAQEVARASASASGAPPPSSANLEAVNRLNSRLRRGRVASSLPAPSRRRWWWNSLKLWLAARLGLCSQQTLAKLGATDVTVSSAASDSESDFNSTSRPAGAYGQRATERPSSPSYRALKSGRASGPRHCPTARGHAPGAGFAATLSNVLALAKADRVFRCRLLASLLVSLLLLVLICLLANLIYRSSAQANSAAFYHQQNLRALNGAANASVAGNRLSLLIDDSDYDLSWLWPGAPAAQSAPSEQLADGRTGEQSANSFEQNLRALLHMIERSERLQQFQLVLSHLTNLQLAQDQFVDITQLAATLVERPPDSAPAANRTQANQGAHRPPPLVGAEHFELASLTLLANLHWPLVKWRHQRQQSLATNFLSFALSPAAPTLSLGAAQTMRNLLASLILAESLDWRAAGANKQHLQQFRQLHQNLKSTSHHLLMCSLNSLSSPPNVAEGDFEDDRLAGGGGGGGGGGGKSALLEHKFCKLLVARYKRMMIALSQLNQNDWLELYSRRQFEPPASVFAGNQDNSPGPAARRYALPLGAQTRAGAQSGNAKSLPGFLLDRLALLDVRNVAELALVSLASEEAPAWAEPADHNDQRRLNELIETLVQLGEQPAPAGPPGREQQAGQQQQQAVPLYDLARSLVGENPMSWMGQLGEQTVGQLEQYRAHFNQLKAAGQASWHDLLAEALLEPWPARRLPANLRAQTYDLFLHPNLTTRLIYGMNEIHFQLLRPTRFIVLHCQQLNVIELKLGLKQHDWSLKRPAALSNSSDAGGRATQPLGQVPIRRVLLGKQRLLVELFEPLEAVSSDSRGQPSPQMAANQIEFGELTATRASDQLQASSTGATNASRLRAEPAARFARNQFVLSISFNKTNLMAAPGAGWTGDKGVEFFGQALADSAGGSSFARPLGAAAASTTSLNSQLDGAPAPSSLGDELRERPARRLMLTRFASDHAARNLFPCFDGPHFRARFQLNLVHEQAQQVAFTTQRRERIQYNANGLLQMSVFERTPVELAASSVGFLVGELANIKSLGARPAGLASPATGLGKQEASEQHIQVQVWAQFELLGQAEHASQLVPQLLAAFQALLQTAHPLDKLDLVAVPARVGGGRAPPSQRDSLGLIWSEERHLLVDTNIVSQELIERSSLLMARQLARQFLGNMVVPASEAADSWPLEALCRQLAPVGLAEAQPDWRLDEQFPLASLNQQLQLEQLGEPLGELASELPLDQLEQATRNANEDNDSDDHFWTGQERLELEQEREPAGESVGAPALRRRRAAVLHMLLLNLLPEPAARARLCRRLLRAFAQRPMSTGQFWRHFSEQLLADSALADDSRLPPGADWPLAEQQQVAGSDGLLTSEAAVAGPPPAANQSERVVFIQRRPAAQTSRQLEDAHQVSATDHHRPPSSAAPVEEAAGSQARHLDSLELVARAWLERPGFPLITAACYRDQLHLRQERFQFSLKWRRPELAGAGAGELQEHLTLSRPVEAVAGVGELGAAGEPEGELGAGSRPETDGGSAPEVWPTPLMLVSRLNPRAPRFFWLSGREMEVALQHQPEPPALSERSGATASPFASDQQQQQPSKGNNKLPLQYSWFKLNHNQTSLVRVNYDERNWEALIGLLGRAHYSSHLLNPLDRANLLDDAMVLMRYGQLSVNLAMNLTLYLELGERDYQPWRTILHHLDGLRSLLNQNPLWQRYVLRLIQPISVVIGWKDDGPHLMRKLRRALFGVALQYGDERVVAKARADFKQWLRSASQPPVPNLQQLVYVAGVRYGDQQEWFHCWQKYQALVALEAKPTASAAGSTSGAKEAPEVEELEAEAEAEAEAELEDEEEEEEFEGADLVENEKRQLLTALASTQNTWLLEQFLNYSLDPNKIQQRHLKHVLRTLGKNPVARLYLWRFVRLNWFVLQERFMSATGTGGANPSGVLETMIVESTRHFASKLDYEEVRAFFEAKHQLLAQQRRQQQQQQQKQRPQAAGQQAASGELGEPGESSGQEAASAAVGQWSPSVGRAIRQSLWTIEANVHWRDSVEPKLTRWLSHQNQMN